MLAVLGSAIPLELRSDALACSSVININSSLHRESVRRARLPFACIGKTDDRGLVIGDQPR